MKFIHNVMDFRHDEDHLETRVRDLPSMRFRIGKKERTFPRSFCGYRGVSNYALRSHFARMHPKDQVEYIGMKTVKCRKCGMDINRKGV